MTFNLRNLIKASGYAGVNGQSFRNNVAGSATGAKMSEYKCPDWFFDTPGAPSTSPIGSSYVGTQTFTIDVSFPSQASRAHYIKRIGSMIVFNPENANNSAGYSASVVSQSVVAAATGSSISISVVPPTDTGTVTFGSPWYADYTYPATPPSGSGSVPVQFKAQMSAVGGGASVVNVRFSFTYDPDIGGFNPQLLKQYINIPFTTRASAISDFDTEWHNNSTYTSLKDTAFFFNISSAPMYSVSYWLRYRRKGDTSWINAGEAAWSDSRLT